MREGELDKGSQKVQTPIRQVSTRDVVFNIVNIINITVCYI